MSILIAKSSEGKTMIALGDHALVGNVYLSIKDTHNKAWKSIIGEELVEEFHKALEAHQETSTDRINWSDMSEHPRPAVRALVAMNGLRLDRLRNDKATIVKEAVIRYCYDALLRVDMGDALRSAYQNIINGMLKDCLETGSILVADIIASRGTQEEIAQLVDFPYDSVKAEVARRIEDPKILEKLSNSGNEFVRCEVASNPNTNRRTLQKLCNDHSSIVRECAVVG